MICQANGGYGERVEEPDEVLPALKRALHAVKEEGRQAGAQRNLQAPVILYR